MAYIVMCKTISQPLAEGDSTEVVTFVEATIKEVYKEMKSLREDLVDEEELMLVRNYLIGTILGDLDGPFQIMGRWKTWYSITLLMIISTVQ